MILDGEVTWDGRSAYHVFDILWLNGRRRRPRCRSKSAARCSQRLPFEAPLQPRRLRRRATEPGNARAAKAGKA